MFKDHESYNAREVYNKFRNIIDSITDKDIEDTATRTNHDIYSTLMSILEERFDAQYLTVKSTIEGAKAESGVTHTSKKQNTMQID
jgi:hypothetical protein